MNCETMFKVVVYVLAGYVALKVLKENCGIDILEGFSLSNAAPVEGGIKASKVLNLIQFQ